MSTSGKVVGSEPLLEGKCIVWRNNARVQQFDGSLVFDDDLQNVEDSFYGNWNIKGFDWVQWDCLATSKFCPSPSEMLLAAQSTMKAFKVSGLFDAMYAATTLNQDSEERTILSTDEVYDRIARI